MMVRTAEQRKQYNREYYLRNKAWAIEQAKQWYKDHKYDPGVRERMKIQSDAFLRDNPERLLQYIKTNKASTMRHYWNNRDEICRNRRQRYQRKKMEEE